MDLRTLRYFVAIAQEKSFTAAAEKLFVTQPTLSRQIAELEDELGQKLFDRTTRRIELTEKGVFLFHQAQSILELVERTKREAMSTKELAGDLVIAAGETPAIEPVAEAIQRFQAEHPLVRVHLRSARAQEAASSLRMGTSHFALFVLPADTEGFDFITLPERNRWGLLTRRDGPLADKMSVTPEDLQGLPLYFTSNRQIRRQVAGWFGAPFDELNVVGSYSLLYNVSLIVRAGGHALGIDGVIRPDDDVAFLPLEPALRTETIFAWRSGGPKRTITEEFLKTLRRRLTERSAERAPVRVTSS